MKSYYFISGLPRSGSTLLSAILNQNPDFYADISSPIQKITEGAIYNISNTPHNLNVNENRRKNLLYGMFDGFYKNINKPIIFDSSRSWTGKTFLLKNLFQYTKILCCVRDITSILNSFEVIFSKDPLHDNKIITNNLDVYSRCDAMMSEEGDGIVIIPLIYLRQGYAANPEMLMLIEYNDLCKTPEKTLRKIYEFLEKPYYCHDFENVEYSNENFDNGCNIKNLHTIRKKVEYDPPRCIIPEEIVNKYTKMNLEFWKKDYKTNVDIINKVKKKFIEYK